MSEKPTYEELEKRNRELEKRNRELEKRLRIISSSENQNHYRKILDCSPFLLYTKDLEGRYTAINKQFENLSGLKKREVIGKTDYELFPPEVAENSTQNDKQIIKTGTPIEFEEYGPVDGKMYTFISTKYPLLDEGGRVYGICGVSSEIIESANIAQSFREKEKLFRTAIKHSPIPIVVSEGIDQIVIMVNDRFTNLFGYTNEDIPDVAAWWGLAYPDKAYREKIRKRWTKAVEKSFSGLSRVEPMEVTIACKDGTLKEVSIEAATVGDVNLVAFVDMTEQKQANQALKESKERYELIYHNAQVGLGRVRVRDGKVLECNEKMARVFGYDDIGTFIEDYSFSDNFVDKDFREKFINELKTNGSLNDIEAQFYRKDGKKIWGRFDSRIFPEQGYMEDVMIDITEQKEAQINLQKTKDRLESLWSIARHPDADINTLCDNVIEEIKKITESEYAFYGFLSDDEKIMELHAWSKDAMKDCEVTDQTIHFPIDKAGIWAESVRKKQVIRINDFQQNLSDKKGVPDGHVPLTRMMTVPLLVNNKIVSTATVANKKTEYTPEDEAQVQAFLSNVQILIDRKNKEETLQFQQKTITLNHKIANVFLTSSENDIFADTLDVILETLQSPFGYFGFIDTDGYLNCPSMTRNIWKKCEMPDKTIVFPKDTWGGLWGDSLKEMKTMVANDGMTLPEGHIQLQCAIAVPIIHHNELIGQFVVADKKGGYDQSERTLLESAASQTAPILYNLLEKQAMEKERRIMQARIEQAQKMESVGNLAGGIAHDFNNILFPIIGMSELMMEDLAPDSVEYEYVRRIYTAGNRAKDLVNQILSFSRRTEHEMMPVKFQRVLKEVLKLCRSTIPTNISIVQDIQQDCGSIWANATQLHQISMNLITNAYHAVQDKNGKITVQLKEFTLEKNEIFSLSAGHGKYAMLSVSDNGTGMSEEIKSKIFEPYFTTKEKGKGTGLGLAVVYGIVKEFGGDIKVLSSVGTGTTFNIYLPLMKKNVDSKVNKAGVDIETGHEHILLVDDEPSIVQTGQLMLERLGYAVTSRVSSIEALEAVTENPDKFDMIISDMSMPAMTGAQLAYEIKKIRPEMPIIICTGFSERINKEKAEEIGVNGFLMKPVDKSDMAQMVRKVLDISKNN